MQQVRVMCELLDSNAASCAMCRVRAHALCLLYAVTAKALRMLLRTGPVRRNQSVCTHSLLQPAGSAL